jgi:uncharacterized protein
MLKYLLIALVIIWLFYSPALRQQLRRPTQTQKPSKSQQPAAPQVMLTCAHCGIHFPSSESVDMTVSGQIYHFCSKDHMRAGPRPV